MLQSATEVLESPTAAKATKSTGATKAKKALREWDTSDWLWYLLCTFCYPGYLVTVCLGWADYQPYEAMSIEAYWEAAPQLWLNVSLAFIFTASFTVFIS